MSDATVLVGDCRERMAEMEPASIDAIVCDPPYGLEFMGKEWDRLWTDRNPAEHARPELRGQTQSPYISARVNQYRAGREAQRWHETWAREAFRVLKPGGHLLAFGGTRTFHRMTVAIEDAGFEIRDCLSWLYGSGFPKSLDVSKAIDKAAGAEREVIGIGRSGKILRANGQNERPYQQVDGYQDHDITAPATPEAEQWQGWGTALKPAWEPVIVARKPLIGTVAANVLQHGTGALNIAATRLGGPSDSARSNGHAHVSLRSVQDDVRRIAAVLRAYNTGDTDRVHDGLGRWPSNVALDEHAAAMLDAQSGTLGNAHRPNRPNHNGGGTRPSGFAMSKMGTTYGDTGGPSRFFFVAAQSPNDDIIQAWSHESAPTVASHSDQPNRPDDSARNDAATSVNHAGTPSSDSTARSTNGTQNASERNGVNDTQPIRNTEQRLSPELPHTNESTLNLANDAVNLLPTDTTTTTANRSTYDFSADPATSRNTPQNSEHGDRDSLSGNRFMYCAKASRSERNAGLDGMPEREQASTWGDLGPVEGNPRKVSTGHVQRVQNHHPTVKPVALMQWLVRLVTPPGGVVLDPFTGSGSTGVACVREGVRFIGIEQSAEYAEIAERRIAHAVETLPEPSPQLALDLAAVAD